MMIREKVIFVLIAILIFQQTLHAKGKSILAILPFENSTGQENLKPLEEGLRDLIIADIGKVKEIMVVERENLERIIKEQKLGLWDFIDKKTQIKIGRLAGVNIILAGGFSLVDSTMKINAHLLDVETTELIKSEEVEGKVTDIVQLSKELTLKLLRDLDIKIELLPELAIDKSPEINLHFIRGLGYYYGCMYDRAIMEFMNTMNLNPEHADARFWNAKSYFAQKAWSHARIELDRFLKEFPQDSRMREVKKINETCWRNMKDWEKELFGNSKRKKER